MKDIDSVSGSNVFFAARKLFELAEVCATPPLSMGEDATPLLTTGEGGADKFDLKKFMISILRPEPHPLAENRLLVEQLSSASRCRSDTPMSTESLPRLTAESRNAMTRAILLELGRLSQQPLSRDSVELCQVEDLHCILGALIDIARDDSKEADARSIILRKVCAWNISSDPRSCGLYCSCLCLMMLGRHSSKFVFGTDEAKRDSFRRQQLFRLNDLLHSIARQGTENHSNLVVEMFIAELVITTCLASRKDSLSTSGAANPPDVSCASVSQVDCAASAAARDNMLPLPANSSFEMQTLHRICTADAPARVLRAQHMHAMVDSADSSRNSKLETSRQIVMGYLVDRADGESVEELHVKNGERLLVEKDGWVCQESFLRVWNRKWSVKQEQTLNSILDFLKQHSRPILKEMIKWAQVPAAASSYAHGPRNLSAKDDRLKVSYYQALAEQGDLEPGNEKCSWIRDIFHMEARASQMEETAHAELQAAIE
jgi:hypothetical protein